MWVGLKGFFVYFFSFFSYHGPLFMVIEATGPKPSFLLLAMCSLEMVTFLVGIGLRLTCLLKVHQKFDAEED